MSNINQQLSKNAKIVQDAIIAKGLDFKVIELNENARTANDAAAVLGCQVAQILKSLIFKIEKSNKPILVLVSGINMVNEKQIATILGESIIKADANFVREVTGFVIGGIPPVGHKQKIETLIDEDLLKFDYLWAAAGTSNAVFRLNAAELMTLTDGKVVRVK